MKYAHILMAVTEERWAMQEEKLVAVLDFLRVQASGAKLAPDEIEARIGRPAERETAPAQSTGQVAILPLRGVIANRMGMMDDISGGTSSERFGRAFQAAVRDQAIKAVVLDVDSPGGAVSGTAELADMIHSARGTKPIVAHVNATAASAAYWIATAADEMVVTPTGSVGSIGVFGVHDDLSAALDKAGIRKTIVKAGKFKAEGLPYGPLGEDAQARMQARVDAAYERFVAAVARNRGRSPKDVRSGFGEGAMVDAEPALAEGMVDGIGTLEDVLQRFGVSQFAPAAPAPAAQRRAFAAAREKRALLLD